MPSWSADGQRVIYVRQAGATAVTGTSIRARLANEAGKRSAAGPHSPHAHHVAVTQLSSDGRPLVHTEQRTAVTIPALPLTPQKTEEQAFPVVLAPSPQARIVQYSLSPDSRWLAYSSTESGREEVYVTHFPSGQGKWQVSQNGATFPAWRGDSKEIWFTGTQYCVRCQRQPKE